MTNPINSLRDALSEWGSQAVDAGWISGQQIPEIPAKDLQTPAQLFTRSERPLVVAFFGGTGVGKSSLLNRLAEQPVAKASAVRPTSTEITLYYHHEIVIDKLPAELPTDKVLKATHSNNRYRDVLWIDMPDFDSIDTSNQALVTELSLIHI